MDNLKMRRILLTLLTLLVLPVAANAQLRPGAFTTITATDTTADSVHIGCAVGSSTCTGGFKAGKGVIGAGLTIGATTTPPSMGITFGDGAPVSTTNTLYQIAGALYFNGSALASGSTVSGTTGTIGVFTGPAAIGNSVITQAAGVVTVGGSQLVTGTLGVSGATTLSSTLDVAGVATFINTGLHVLDTNASHDVIFKPGSDITADRVLTFTTGDSDRTITLSGNPALSDWFDQSVKTTASPAFAAATVVPGSSAITASVGGTIYTSVTPAANVGSGEQTLYSQAVAASTLSVNGQAIRMFMSGVLANNGNAKTIRIKWNGATVGSFSSTNDPYWVAEAYIFRTGAATQSITVFIGSPGATSTWSTGTATLSGAVTLAMTADAVSSDDVIFKNAKVEWVP